MKEALDFWAFVARALVVCLYLGMVLIGPMFLIAALSGSMVLGFAVFLFLLGAVATALCWDPEPGWLKKASAPIDWWWGRG